MIRILLAFDRAVSRDDKLNPTTAMAFAAKLCLCAVVLAALLAQVGCRDGLIEPPVEEEEPIEEPDAGGGCSMLPLSGSPGDAPDGLEGMLTALIVSEARAAGHDDVHVAADAVLESLPAAVAAAEHLIEE